jgi:hypothetical protein
MAEGGGPRAGLAQRVVIVGEPSAITGKRRSSVRRISRRCGPGWPSTWRTMRPPTCRSRSSMRGSPSMARPCPASRNCRCAGSVRWGDEFRDGVGNRPRVCRALFPAGKQGGDGASDGRAEGRLPCPAGT